MIKAVSPISHISPFNMGSTVSHIERIKQAKVALNSRILMGHDHLFICRSYNLLHLHVVQLVMVGCKQSRSPYRHTWTNELPASYPSIAASLTETVTHFTIEWNF